MLPDFKLSGLQLIDVRPIWGAEHPGHRSLIRQAVFELTSDATVLDLGSPPRVKNPYVSISHTVGLGGFVTGRYPLGLDIESQDRLISTAVLKRLGSPLEASAAPSAVGLWVAKEASFKALYWSTPIKTVSQIEVSDWSRVDDTRSTFKFRDINDLGRSGLGYLTAHGRFTLGIATVRP